jgi:hypothetical protein
MQYRRRILHKFLPVIAHESARVQDKTFLAAAMDLAMKLHPGSVQPAKNDAIQVFVVTSSFPVRRIQSRPGNACPFDGAGRVVYSYAIAPI